LRISLAACCHACRPSDCLGSAVMSAVGRRQRVGELGGEVGFGQGHRQVRRMQPGEGRGIGTRIAPGR
jgi:hypothetical protein